MSQWRDPNDGKKSLGDGVSRRNYSSPYHSRDVVVKTYGSVVP